MIHDSKAEMKLLSTILSTEDNDNSFSNAISGLRKIIKNEYLEIMDKGSYPEKGKNLEDVDRIVDQIESFVEHPNLIGKIVIGVFSDTRNLRADILGKLFNVDPKKDNIMLNNSIPMIFTNCENYNLFSLNKFNKKTPIKGEEVHIIFHELNDYRIDFRQFVLSINVEDKLRFENIAVIDFPQYVLKDEELKKLVGITDMIVVAADAGFECKKTLNFLSNSGYDKKVIVFAPSANDELKSVLKNRKLNAQLVEHGSFPLLEGIVKEENKRINNFYHMDKLNEQLLKVQAYYYTNIKKNEEVIGSLNSDIANLEEDNQELRAFRNEVNKNITIDEEITKSLEDLRKLIEKQMNDIVSLFNQYCKQKNNLFLSEIEEYSEGRKDCLFNIAKLYVTMNKYELALPIAEQLINEGYKKANIIFVMIADAKGVRCRQEAINYLIEEKSINQDILKAKIMFRKRLGIANEDAAKYCLELDTLESAEEFYLLGEHFQNINLDKSKRYFKLSLEKGKKEAGDKLYKVFSKEPYDYRNLSYLGNLLNARANYDLGMYHLGRNEYGRAIFYLKLAGIFDHKEAICELGNMYFYESSFDKAVVLYRRALELGVKDDNIYTRLGVSYYIRKEYSFAHDTLIKCSSADAYFHLGKIYEYGNGRVENWDTALKYYEKAMNMGHSNGKSYYFKLSSRIQERNAKKSSTSSNQARYNSSASYSSTSSGYSSSSSSSSSSGCFLTTATCKALGKEDECEELISFKYFRDTWLVHQDDGEELIKEYYRIAPTIVENIEKTENPKEIYNYMWDKYIKVGYGYLLEKDYIKSKETYIEMVKEMMDRYY